MILNLAGEAVSIKQVESITEGRDIFAASRNFILPGATFSACAFSIFDGESFIFTGQTVSIGWVISIAEGRNSSTSVSLLELHGAAGYAVSIQKDMFRKLARGATN